MEIIFFVLLSIFYHIDLISSFAVFTLFSFEKHANNGKATGVVQRVWLTNEECTYEFFFPSSSHT